MSMIELDQITKRYVGGGRPAVDGVSLRVEAGEFVAVVGESGCGKTTMLKLINRLIEPTAGRVRVDGQDVQSLDPVQLRRGIGYIFQGIGLLPHRTVAENLVLVPSLLGWDRKRQADRVDELLSTVNLAGSLAGKFPHQLSGGQQQRVGVGRALAAQPKLVLMDEPFGALDPINRDALQDEYGRLHQTLGLTSVMVTHDMAEALLLADRIAVMRDGRLLQYASPSELMHTPNDPYVSQLIETPKRQADRLEKLAGQGGDG
jgi:osmoprotectant transport system ATP-binding protein